MKLSVFTDGGSRGNPGPAALGVVIKKGEDIVYSTGKTLGVTTNNVAEYSAILEAFSWIEGNSDIKNTLTGVDFFMDSQLACRQLQGEYKIKQPHLLSLFLKIKKKEKNLGVSISYTHIPREKNKQADAMVNRALDNNW